MDRNTFIKISAAIFIFLGLVISLFPPFEFGRSEGFHTKKYDFIFGNIEKYIIVNYDTFQRKIYIPYSLEYYEKLYKDCDFNFLSSSTDTFYVNPFTQLVKQNGNIVDKVPDWVKNAPKKNNNGGIPDWVKNAPSKNNSIPKVDCFDEKPKIDSIKRYDIYSISEPIYLLLDRKLLLSELIVEYILALFVSLIAGYFISKLKLRKVNKTEF